MIYQPAQKDFLKQIIIPTKTFNTTSNDPWYLKDVTGNFLLASNTIAQEFGFENHSNLINLNLKNLPFKHPRSLNELLIQEKEILALQKITHNIAIFELKHKTIIMMTTNIPILFQEQVIAIETLGKFIDQANFNLELYLAINNIPTTTNPREIFTEGQIEEHIIYLLMLKKTQQQIADILNVSRARVAQRIHAICNRANIPGHSAKLMIEQAFLANYHKRIPLELFFINLNKCSLYK